MELIITHDLHYRYSQPVTLDPQTIRLRPRTDGGQALLSHELEVSPEPTGECESTELFGNVAKVAWFIGQTSELRIRAVSRVRTFRSNPFDYLITDPTAMVLPVKYEMALENGVLPYTYNPALPEIVEAFAREVFDASQGQTLEFLQTLAQQIAQRCTMVVRQDGDSWEADKTLGRGEGACRDLAVVFVAVCRRWGLACRFVSGYHHGDDQRDSHDLHAWAEVYLPGAGWRGYDPSLGVAVADRHVPLASGPHPRDAAPTVGSFRGSDATSTLEFEVKLQEVGEGGQAQSQG